MTTNNKGGLGFKSSVDNCNLGFLVLLKKMADF